MAYSNASIRRAVSASGLNGRHAHIHAWSNIAIDRALDLRRDAETEADKKLYSAIDSVAYGIRWSEMTGRTNLAAFHNLPWKDTRDIIERMVSICLRSGNTSADFVKECWKELAELRAQHLSEAA